MRRLLPRLGYNTTTRYIHAPVELLNHFDFLFSFLMTKTFDIVFAVADTQLHCLLLSHYQSVDSDQLFHLLNIYHLFTLHKMNVNEHIFVNRTITIDYILSFVQVLRLLEDMGLPELIIQLATMAITEAANDVRSQVGRPLRLLQSLDLQQPPPPP